MHPYFRCGADLAETRLDLPVRERLVLDHNGMPTGELEAFDGVLGKIGDRALDLVLRRDDTPGEAAAEIAGSTGTIHLRLGPSFRWLVVFTGETLPREARRRSVAVEPLTCPPNAFASATDVISLVAKQRWSDHWLLAWSSR
jgi:aldose 1-epimerase